jgi:hypothetical protein
MATNGIKIGKTLYTEQTSTINLSDYTGLIDESEKNTPYEQNILEPGSSDIPPDKDAEYETKKYDTLVQVIRLCQASLNKLLLENLNLDDLRITKYGRMDSLKQQEQIYIKNPNKHEKGFFSDIGSAFSTALGSLKCAFTSCPKSK